MKRQVLFVMMSFLAVTACNMEELSREEQPDVVTNDHFQLPPYEAELKVYYQASCSWSATVEYLGESDWIQFPSSGDAGLSELDINVASNINQDAGERSCLISFSSTDSPSDVAHRIEIIQEQPLFSIKETELAWAWNETDKKQVQVETNLRYDIQNGNSAWIIERNSDSDIITIAPSLRNLESDPVEVVLSVVPDVSGDQDWSHQIKLLQEPFVFTLDGKSEDVTVNLNGNDFEPRKIAVICDDKWNIEKFSSDLISAAKGTDGNSLVVQIKGTGIVEKDAEASITLKADCGVTRKVLIKVKGVKAS